MNGTPTHFVFSKIFDFQLKKKKMKFIYTFLTKQLSIKKKNEIYLHFSNQTTQVVWFCLWLLWNMFTQAITNNSIFMHSHSVFYVYIIHDPAVIIRVLLTYEPTSRLEVT